MRKRCFPQRDESEYDAFGTAHASIWILVRPWRPGPPGGMAFEALSDAGIRQDIGLLVVITDSDMSISPALGGGTDLHLRRKERRGGVLIRKASSALSRFG